VRISLCVTLLLGSVLTPNSYAETAVTHADAASNCINVEVNGYQALSYECLSQKLANPNGKKATERNQEAMNVPLDKRPPNQLGLFNQSATGIRMGNTFGTAVKPQRPTP
jgi:hypothetical protein